MLDESRLAIHQVTLRDQWSFRESIEGLARHGVHTTAIWREKLAEIDLADAVRIVRDHSMNVLSLIAGGLVTSPDKTAYQAAIDENRRLIEATAALGAGHLVVLSGGLEQGSTGLGGAKDLEGAPDLQGARSRALDAFATLVPDARAAGIKLGLEPLHPMLCANRAVLCTLEQTNDWSISSPPTMRSASSSTPTMFGGTLTSPARSPAPGSASARFTSATGWPRRKTCGSTAA